MMPLCAKKPLKKCNCCEKRLRKTDKDKAKCFRKKKYRQCDKCNGKVCRSCGLNNICHECVIKETITLDPDALMQTDRKTLLNYLTTLHCIDYAFQTLDSKYLVKQILARYSVHEDWDPATLDYSPPQLRRSKIQQERNYPPKPQPAERSAKKNAINNRSEITFVQANQTPGRNPFKTDKNHEAPNILPLSEIKSAAYFDKLTVAELKYFLQEQSVSSVNIHQRQELKRIAIEIWRKFCQNQIRTSSIYEYNRSVFRAAQPRQNAPRKSHQQPTGAVVRAPSLRNIRSQQEIDSLSFEELVIILHKYNINPHSYKSTVEMANQVKMLWSISVRRPVDHKNGLGNSSKSTQHHTSVHPSHSTINAFHQDHHALDHHQGSHNQKPTGPQSPGHQKLHPSQDYASRDRSGDTAVQQTVHYANVHVNEHHRGAHSGQSRALHPEVEAINGIFDLHQATFVPEVHYIPLQTVQVEHLPPEPLSIQDFKRQEDIAALSNEDLVELLEQNNVSFNRESRTNKKHLVDMVTKLWLLKKGPEALPEVAEPRMQLGITNGAYRAQLPRNKQDVSLLDITSPGDIDGLSNAQLKHILQKHNMISNYYVERRDLALEVRLLWDRYQKQQIEGKSVGRSKVLREQHQEQAESLNKSDSIKQTEELRHSFFRSVLPPPVPSPRASLQREAANKTSSLQEFQSHFREEPPPQRPAQPPTPPVRDYTKTITSRSETSRTGTVLTARIEPFIDRPESTISHSSRSLVKPYLPVYPRDREISRSKSTCSETDILKVENIRPFSKNVSLADISAPEEIQEMPVRDIRMLLEKYDVEIYPGAEKGHLIELVTKLWDKRQTQGSGLAIKNGQQWERFRSFKSKSSEVVYAQIVHVSSSGGGTVRTVRSTQDLHLDSGMADAKTPDFLAQNLSKVQSLQDITSPEIIAKLNSRQIKSILLKHAVDISAFTEKEEMAHCLRNLWHDERNSTSSDSNYVSGSAKTCCVCERGDRPPDCVFLNCGHMIMCMDCGSQTKECPKCRQYIVRVVRVFKS